MGQGADAGADRRADLLAAAGLILALVPLDGATLWLFAGRRADHCVQRQPRSADAVSELSAGRFLDRDFRPGLAVAGETFWRSLAAMAATLWLVLNLPFPQLIILLKRGRVPRLLTEQILLTWRFIFILLDEAMAIHRAQTLRFGYGSVPQGYRSLAMLVGLLFTRVLLRYQQMSTALDIKLYQGDFHL